MYKLLKDRNNSDRTDMILRVSDNANVPNDMNNSDWKRYQKWLLYGNTPLAAE